MRVCACRCEECWSLGMCTTHTRLMRNLLNSRYITASEKLHKIVTVNQTKQLESSELQEDDSDRAKED